MTITNTQPILHAVTQVRLTNEDDVLDLTVDITDNSGDRYECGYISRSDDTFGLNPVIRQWLADNAGSYEVLPYVEPTAEERRASMSPLDPRQLRLGLVRAGISMSAVYAALDALPAGPEKEEAEIEWEYAPRFLRLAPALLTIAGALGLSPEAVDALWATALSI